MKRSGPDHPKMKHLAQLLNIEIWGAVGLMELLWHFAGKYAPQGDIGRYSDEVIAKAIHWDKRPGRTRIPPEFLPSSGLVHTELWLISSLIRAEFIDRCDCHRLVIHDWKDHAEEAVKKFLSRHSLDFVHTVSPLPSHAMPSHAMPEPAAASVSAPVVLNRPGEFNSAAAIAAAAGLPARIDPSNEPKAAAANGRDPVQAAFHELAREGCRIDRYETNEFGAQVRNPVSERVDAAIERAYPRILAARMPVAFAKKIILDALKGA